MRTLFDEGLRAGLGGAPQRPADISFFLTANISFIPRTKERVIVKTVEEIILNQILWDFRFYAYKKKFDANAKDVTDVLTREENRLLINIYERAEYLKAQRLMENPTVRKLMNREYFV